LELHQLKLFQLLAEELHFGRAAKRAHISQPGLSHQIKRLESELGITLVHRTSRKVELTAAGDVFARGSKRLLDELNELVLDAKRTASGTVGHLRIGFVGTAMLALIPEVVQQMRARHPKVVLSLNERGTSSLIQELLKKRLDVAFIYNLTTGYPGLEVKAIAQESVGLALPSGHPLARRKRVQLSEFANDNFILFPRSLGPDNYDCLMRACATSGFTPKIVQEAENIPTILGLVSCGLGVAFASETVMQSLQREGVTFVKLKASPKLGMKIAYREDLKNPTLDTFLHEVHAVLDTFKDNVPPESTSEL